MIIQYSIRSRIYDLEAHPFHYPTLTHYPRLPISVAQHDRIQRIKIVGLDFDYKNADLVFLKREHFEDLHLSMLRVHRHKVNLLEAVLGLGVWYFFDFL
jgi:hypothetical protein